MTTQTKKFNVVLLTEVTSEIFLIRSLGAYKVAAELIKAGYDTQVIDFLHTFSAEELLEVLSNAVNENTLFVGFSTVFYKNISNVSNLNQWSWEQGGIRYGPRELGSMIPHGIQYNEQIKNVVKSKNPNCKLVLGSPDAQDVYYIKDFDYTVVGYAETSAVNLANHLAHGEPLEKSYRSLNRSIIINDAKAPDYDFANTPMYFDKKSCIFHQETLSLEVTRGCIFKCAFCSFPLNGKTKNDHIKNEEVLEKEFLYNFENFGTTRYLFSDDTFNDSTEKIKMVHRVSKRLPFKLEYWAFIRLDLLTAHREQVDLLFDSGLRACFLGVETFNPRTASAIGKGGSRVKQADTLRYIKNKYGDSVNLNGSFIFGLPYETVESMKQTGEYLLSGDFQLDSWLYTSLLIYGDTHFYRSDLDTNYSKYGYKLGEFNEKFKAYEWENEFTNSAECRELADYYNKFSAEIGNSKVPGFESFYACNAGVSLEHTLNKPVKDVDWYKLNLKKLYRAKQYKQQLKTVISQNNPPQGSL